MFGDDSEIRELREKWNELSYDEKIDKFLWKMVWFHHQKHIPGNPNAAIQELTAQMKLSSEASGRLTESIRKATWAAAIIGGIGVAIAAVNLVSDLLGF